MWRVNAAVAGLVWSTHSLRTTCQQRGHLVAGLQVGVAVTVMVTGLRVAVAMAVAVATAVAPLTPPPGLLGRRSRRSTVAYQVQRL